MAETTEGKSIMLKKIILIVSMILAFWFASARSNAGTEMVEPYTAPAPAYNYAPPPPRPVYYAPPPPVSVVVYPAFGYYGSRFGFYGAHHCYGRHGYWRSHHHWR
jgi:hypothetical protein